MGTYFGLKRRTPSRKNLVEHCSRKLKLEYGAMFAKVKKAKCKRIYSMLKNIASERTSNQVVRLVFVVHLFSGLLIHN